MQRMRSVELNKHEETFENTREAFLTLALFLKIPKRLYNSRIQEEQIYFFYMVLGTVHFL